MVIEFLKFAVQLSPLLILLVSSFIPLVLKVLNGNKEPSFAFVLGIGISALLASLVLFLSVGFNHTEILSLYFDDHGSGAAVLVALASLYSFPLFFWNRSVDKSQLSEITFLFLNGVLSLYVFCLAKDLMTAFVGLEVASLVLYVLISMSRKDSLSLESSIKYFILSSFAGVIFLYGISFLYGASGDLSFFFLSEQSEMLAQSNRFFFLGLSFIFAGLFFKMALFPFHFWLVDVYTGALTPVTTFMATAVKSAVVLFIAKFLSFSFFKSSEQGSLLIYGLAGLSVLTALSGGFMALTQTKIKRIIAFSSLSHSGYLMMLLVGIFALSSFDFKPVFYYLLAYIFMTGGMLNGIQCLEEKSKEPVLDDLKGFFKAHPFVSISLSCFLLSLAGAPPFFGFFAKLSILKVLVSSQNWWVMLWLFVASALGLYYYIRPITFMLQEGEGSLNVPKLAKINLVFSLALTLFGTFFFGYLF